MRGGGGGGGGLFGAQPITGEPIRQAKKSNVGVVP